MRATTITITTKRNKPHQTTILQLGYVFVYMEYVSLCHFVISIHQLSIAKKYNERNKRERERVLTNQRKEFICVFCTWCHLIKWTESWNKPYKQAESRARGWRKPKWNETNRNETKTRDERKQYKIRRRRGKK